MNFKRHQEGLFGVCKASDDDKGSEALGSDSALQNREHRIKKQELLWLTKARIK